MNGVLAQPRYLGHETSGHCSSHAAIAASVEHIVVSSTAVNACPAATAPGGSPSQFTAPRPAQGEIAGGQGSEPRANPCRTAAPDEHCAGGPIRYYPTASDRKHRQRRSHERYPGGFRPGRRDPGAQPDEYTYVYRPAEASVQELPKALRGQQKGRHAGRDHGHGQHGDPAQNGHGSLLLAYGRLRRTTRESKLAASAASTSPTGEGMGGAIQSRVVNPFTSSRVISLPFHEPVGPSRQHRGGTPFVAASYRSSGSASSPDSANPPPKPPQAAPPPAMHRVAGSGPSPAANARSPARAPASSAGRP